jgi:hypothetical protein
MIWFFFETEEGIVIIPNKLKTSNWCTLFVYRLVGRVKS